LVNSPVNHPAGNRADHSPSYLVRNPENYVTGYSASYWMGCLPENPASYSRGYRDSNSANYSADCRDNRPGRNPESNGASNGADNPFSYPEGNPADSSAGHRVSSSYNSGRHVEGCPQPCRRPAQGHDPIPPGNWDRAPSRDLLCQDDLANDLRPAACLCLRFPYEVHPRRQRPHVIHAGL